MSKIDTSAINLTTKYNNLWTALNTLTSKYYQTVRVLNTLKAKVDNIPDIYFCRECLPVFSIAAEARWIMTYGKQFIYTRPAFAVNTNYRLNDDLTGFFQYTIPFSLDYYNSSNQTEQKHTWDVMIFEIGALYDLQKKNSNQ